MESWQYRKFRDDVRSGRIDWRGIQDGKKKYEAYLCSNEWATLRRKVKKRCGGICERCIFGKHEATHHLTYDRKYNENLEDLQALCHKCHAFVHGKAQVDPANFCQLIVAGQVVRSFYLAGKITKTTWRDEIVPGWSMENKSPPYATAHCSPPLWCPVRNAAETRGGKSIDFTGPWWRDVAGAGGGHASCEMLESPHGYSTSEQDGHGIAVGVSQEDFSQAANAVSRCVIKAIEQADLVFAWIESDDCLGTMLEIGLAFSAGKVVVIASPPGFDQRETWLAMRIARYRVYADSAGAAWRLFWASPTSEAESMQKLFFETEAAV